MASTALNAASRQAALQAMTGPDGVDILVIGGGVTGAGIALDAASRGLRTAIVEAQDWAGGTSQWSSKLVHGGLRYLYNLDFMLVAEALKERGLLLERTAPHLVKPQPFLWPLKTPVLERSYSAVGVGMYDMLAQIGGGGHSAVPMQKHYSKSGALKLFPGIRDDSLTGAIRFYDARVDDARLVIDLVRTAAGLGALAASRTHVVGIDTDPTGHVTDAVVTDLESGETKRVKAAHVIAATGVWTEQTQDLVRDDAGLQVLASKGIHIVVPKDRINGSTGLFLRTEKSVLFIIPWERYWVIGTTDTAWHEDLAHPVVTADDIDYVLQHANSVLAEPLTRDDIIGTYAGLRPLLQPRVKDDKASAKVSREHTVVEVAPGMSAIAGGKLTTYRVMAEDAVDFALTSMFGANAPRERPCVTTEIPLVGAARYQAAANNAEHLAKDSGLTREQIDHLLSRYGDEIDVLLTAVREDPDLARPVENAPAYLRAEVPFSVTHEGALHLEDILRKRIRLDYEMRDRGLCAAREIADLAAPLLGWTEEDVEAEIAAYAQRVTGEAAAELQADDAAAAAARAQYPDLIPLP